MPCIYGLESSTVYTGQRGILASKAWLVLFLYIVQDTVGVQKSMVSMYGTFMVLIIILYAQGGSL